MQVDRLTKLLDFLKDEPNDPFLLYALATEYLRLNQGETALSYYEGLVKDHPKYVGTYYHLGKLYEALNRKDDAITTYQTGMKIAREIRDNHALSELQSVYNTAVGFGDDDDEEY
ncbi:heme biosynthesis protein HemY [Mucilaginibacter myungsuensis]|uniref:Tetratricopeptide repeat protein n=1 Tax=Mucilaginibacter myungsuensis TaxID=649104 RepID=A0A929PVQ9_9SPHI|nr:tetratricopeptide repeat protein [Mucilaginibacter myungsuensis]MBE9660575.1 tetratricopeptide repeat protein [Mucilaginibacter myungsuensis]MDN3600619.1 tetratricopeptide repeat protein [Mucilaginibacter myungsuensis]